MALSQQDIAKYRKELLLLKETILHKIAEMEAEVKNPDGSKGYSQHQADEGSDDFDKTIALRLSDEDRAILQKIEHALKRIDEGSYGICELSGAQIPRKRLDALPYATTTVAAQSQFEQGKKP